MTALVTFTLGTVVVITAQFLDGEDPQVPDTVTCSVRWRSNQPVDVPIERDGDNYVARYKPPHAGDYAWLVLATGAKEGAEDGMFRVRASRFEED